MAVGENASTGRLSGGGSKPEPEQSINGGPEAISVLIEFGAIVKKASKYTSIYADFGKVIDQKSSLELQLNDKNKEISIKDGQITSLEAINQKNLDTYEGRYSEWANEKARLQGQITAAKTEADERNKTTLKEVEFKHKKEFERLKKDIATEKRRSSSLEEKLKVSKAEETQARQELNLAKTRLKEWDGKLSVLKDVDLEKLDTKFKDLNQHYMTIMESHFLKDLPDYILTERHWDLLPRALNNLPLRLPPSNSPAAKNVRLVAALAFLSPLINDHIFAPTRVPTSGSASRNTRLLLTQQQRAGNRRENMLRALLLSTPTSDELDHTDSWAVDYLLKEAGGLLGRMLENPGRFLADLGPVLRSFWELWKDALVSKKLVYASIEADGEWEWGDLPLLDGEVPPPDAQPGKFTTLNLFPRVIVPEIEQVISTGTLVWSDQHSIMSSESECQLLALARRSSVSGSGSSAVLPPRRKKTVDGGSRNASAPSSPMMPRTGASGNHFLGDASGSHGNGGP